MKFQQTHKTCTVHVQYINSVHVQCRLTAFLLVEIFENWKKICAVRKIITMKINMHTECMWVNFAEHCQLAKFWIPALCEDLDRKKFSAIQYYTFSQCCLYTCVHVPYTCTCTVPYEQQPLLKQAMAAVCLSNGSLTGPLCSLRQYDRLPHNVHRWCWRWCSAAQDTPTSCGLLNHSYDTWSMEIRMWCSIHFY